LIADWALAAKLAAASTLYVVNERQKTLMRKLPGLIPERRRSEAPLCNCAI
jgi:hypothetical protein